MTTAALVWGAITVLLGLAAIRVASVNKDEGP